MLAAISGSLAHLTKATAQGFERIENDIAGVNRRLDVLDERMSVLEAQHREVVTRIEQVPDKIEETYGKMLNEHEDRIHALEVA